MPRLLFITKDNGKLLYLSALSITLLHGAHFRVMSSFHGYLKKSLLCTHYVSKKSLFQCKYGRKYIRYSIQTFPNPENWWRFSAPRVVPSFLRVCCITWIPYCVPCFMHLHLQCIERILPAKIRAWRWRRNRSTRRAKFLLHDCYSLQPPLHIRDRVQNGRRDIRLGWRRNFRNRRRYCVWGFLSQGRLIVVQIFWWQCLMMEFQFPSGFSATSTTKKYLWMF